MGEIIQINKHLKTCENCHWHDSKTPGCKKPGGWRWSKNFSRCLDFKRKMEVILNDKY